MKIFSFCIYGDNMKYYLGLRENIRLIRENFPDFHIFIYCGLTRLDDFLQSISTDEFIHLINTNMNGVINMFYRYVPLLLEDAEIVFSRDADSEINERDRWIINDFLNEENTSKSIQTIRDHYWHKSRLTGGLTGFHLNRLKVNNREIFDDLIRSLSQSILNIQLNKSNEQNITYGGDEQLLNEYLWPIIKDELIVYSNINIFEGDNYKSIDFENNGYNFCGNVINYFPSGEKSYQFNYFEYPLLKQIVWLYHQTQTELVISLVDEFGYNRIHFDEKPYILDYVLLSLFKRNSVDAISECFIKYQEFAKYDITPGVRNQIPTFFKMVRSLGYQIIGTCDTEYTPKLFEFVIYFGNYPDDYMALPQSYRIYRHFIFFKDTPIDRFVSHSCWDKIDRIFIMGLEGEFERMNDTWMHLCAMNAPLDRIEEYRAKKDKTLTDIYIGATKNHMDCLKSMKDAGYGCCLFLEDDFVFTSRIRENQESLTEFFKRDYDYNICFLSASKYHERKDHDDLLLKSKQICTTSSGYLVSKTNIDTVFNKVREGYELLLENPECSHIYCIDRWWTSLDKIYIFKKKLGFQKPSLSKITGKLNIELD